MDATSPVIAVAADPATDPILNHRAQQIAKALHLPEPNQRPSPEVEFLLAVTAGRLELRVIGGPPTLRGGRPLYVDAGHRDTTSAAGSRLRQPLLRALGIRLRRDLRERSPRIIDATAGWGRDAMMLATLGCRVLAMERHGVVARLLADGIARASAEGHPAGDRIKVLHADAIILLRQGGGRGDLDQAAGLEAFGTPEAVYLDPMFPEKRRGAVEAKAMRVLRRLTGPEDQGGALLDAARQRSVPRVVVKRPLRAAPLGGTTPDASYPGKAMRYDLYITPG